MTAQSIVMIAGRDPTLGDGGHASYVVAHALAARAIGLAPVVFCASDRTEALDTDYGTLRRIASPFHYGYLNERIQRPFLARGIVRYVAELRQPGPHILHSFGAWAATGVRATRLLARRRIATIPVASAFTTLEHENRAKIEALKGTYGLGDQGRFRREMLWVRAVAGRAECRGYSRSALVLVNYETVRELVSAACDPAPELRLMPYATPAAFAERGPRESPAAEPPLLVSVARHDPRKGLDVFIRALAGLSHKGIPFRAILVGQGPLLAAHRRLVVELGLRDQVEIPGFVDDVFAYLSRADVFVLPSVEEGSGSMALLEALQAGVAVVASCCDGIPEDLRDETDALLVAPGDAEELERVLSRLIGDRRLQARLAERARAVFKERFAAERLTDALGSLYEQLLSPPGSADPAAAARLLQRQRS